jgi:hypothetical protein
MDATNTSSAFRRGLTSGRAMFAEVLILALVVSAWGQKASPQLGLSAKQPEWHKYVNREYGFSFWYPDTYRPSNVDWCKDNDYRRYLLCLERRDDSDTSILVTIITAEPFHLYPDLSDTMPRRQLIGRHVFYHHVVGSSGAGNSDHFDLNLRGKDLEVDFVPAQMPQSTAIPPIEVAILKTFRTF